MKESSRADGGITSTLAAGSFDGYVKLRPSISYAKFTKGTKFVRRSTVPAAFAMILNDGCTDMTLEYEKNG